MTNFPRKEEREERRVAKGTVGEEEDTRAQGRSGGEQSAGAYTPTGRKYGKRRPASFSSIRFELLSSRRALSIVAENYFIIARSAGLECSPRGELQGEDENRRVVREGEREGPTRRRTTMQYSRFRDLLILRRKTAGLLARKTRGNLPKRNLHP